MKNIVLLLLLSHLSIGSIASEPLKKVLQSGDGKSFQTAFEVQSVDQEFDVLKHLKCSPRLQMLVVKDGNFYDLIQTDSEIINFKITSFFSKKIFRDE
jgi:hypothetical protein